uniref:FSH1 domain-containing protein n=1 Tax=Macrostomum lignano TaxID=282301 RepID=A0A1I8FKU8_9PLAT
GQALARARRTGTAPNVAAGARSRPCQPWCGCHPLCSRRAMKLTKRRVQLSKWLLPRVSESAAAAVADSDRKISPGARRTEQLHTDTSIKQRVLYLGVRLDAGSYASTQPGSITLPTLLITGTADRIADPARSAAFVAAGQALANRWTAGLTWAPGTSCTLICLRLAVKLHQDLMQ